MMVIKHQKSKAPQLLNSTDSHNSHICNQMIGLIQQKHYRVKLQANLFTNHWTVVSIATINKNNLRIITAWTNSIRCMQQKKKREIKCIRHKTTLCLVWCQVIRLIKRLNLSIKPTTTPCLACKAVNSSKKINLIRQKSS